VTSVDRDNRRSAFSTYGPHVAVCAPGERIFGVSRRGYGVNSGTSFAAPFVTGVVALMLARARRSGRRLRPAEVRNLLIRSVTPLGAGYNPSTGHGLVNAPAALRAVDEYIGRPA
jgi:subtilisin family serine protease